MSAILTMIGLGCAGLLYWAAAQSGTSPTWLDAPPVHMFNIYFVPAHGFIAATFTMWVCWIVAALIYPQAPSRPRGHRIAVAALAFITFTAGIGASGAAILIAIEEYTIQPIGPNSENGCRIVIRTEPWMAAAHGDYLIQRPGQAQLQSSGVEWKVSKGGPTLPYEKYWQVRWHSEHATVTDSGTPKTTNHIDC